MASVIDICNLALANLGDVATVSSIDPPEGSAQAEHCARFYPIARDTLQEVALWGFATRREVLTLLNVTVSPWLYTYQPPSNMLRAISVLPDGVPDDYALGEFLDPYAPRSFTIESAPFGRILLSNTPNATLRYTVRVTDSTQFPPMFTVALSHLLASMLAGPLLKGDVGQKEAKAQRMLALNLAAAASTIDAQDRKPNVIQSVPWIAGR